MRAVRVPVFVLAAVLAYILCNAAWVTGESQRWLDAAAQVSDAALQGSAEDAGEALDALDRGCCIIEAGHFETENPVCEVLADALQKAADALQYNVTVFCLKDDPFGR